MRALWIGAALLACAGTTSAAGYGHGGREGRGHGSDMGSAMGHSSFRTGVFARFDGASNGAWGFGHGADYVHGAGFGRGYGRDYRGSSYGDYRRYRWGPRYGIAGGLYDHGAPHGYGYADESETASAYGDRTPGGFGRRPEFSGDAFDGFGAGRGYRLSAPMDVYNHSGQGAYAYGYNGYAQTPSLPVSMDYPGYGRYGTAYAYAPSATTCGC